MSAAAWRNGAALGLLAWAFLILAIIGARPVPVLTYVVIALIVAAVLCWPASALARRVADRRRDRARRRVSTYLANAERARLYADLGLEDVLTANPAAAAERLGAHALAQALDRAPLYGVRSDTALLPTAVDDHQHYPPRLTRRREVHPLDAAGLDASVARHPARRRPLAEVVPFPGSRA